MFEKGEGLAVKKGGKAVRSKLLSSLDDEGWNIKARRLDVSRREWMKRTAAWSTAWLTGSKACEAAETMTLAIPRSGTVLPADSAMCDPTVSTWTKGERVVHIVGTAHISSDSAVLAGKLVREVHPEAVFVELDAKRIGKVVPTSTRPKPLPKASVPAAADASLSFQSSLAIPPAPSVPDVASQLNFNPFDVRERMLRAGSQLLGEAINKLYQNLNNQGFSPGEEFAIAIQEGLNIDAVIVLGDQDVNYTLRRLTQALAKTDIDKLFAPNSSFEKAIENTLPQDLRLAIQNLDNDKQLNAKQLALFVETMKNKQTVAKIMNNLKDIAPELYNALVAERDLFMATGLDSLHQFHSIVAVMGLAHLNGVENYLTSFGWSPVIFKC